MSCGICYNKRILYKPCRCSFKICIYCLDKCAICPQCRRVYSFSTDWRLFEYFRYYPSFDHIFSQTTYIDGVIIHVTRNKLITITK